MLYTVGKRDEIEADMAAREAEGKRLYKEGMGAKMGGMYRGGICWVTQAAAQAFVDAHPNDGLAVYGLEAELKHTMQYPEEEFMRLLVNKPIARLP